MNPMKHSLGPAFYRAIGDDDPTGKVLVMASNGHPETSLGGGTKLSRLQNHKMAGLLCDGTIRDYEELESYDFAVYCKGETVRAGGNEVLPYLSESSCRERAHISTASRSFQATTSSRGELRRSSFQTHQRRRY